MKPTSSNEFYLGWDVGAWYCDRSESADALVLLDSSRTRVGRPRRGNLRSHINQCKTTQDWITKVFSLFQETLPAYPIKMTMAIDTPLGFPEGFLSLANGFAPVSAVDGNEENPYLYRKTEQLLFGLGRGVRPLSAITHMIGSQATKGMHVLAKFCPDIEDIVVWTDGTTLTAIETYPSACTKLEPGWLSEASLGDFGQADINDAGICALIAFVFANERMKLWQPPSDISRREGWIWVPDPLVV